MKNLLKKIGFYLLIGLGIFFFLQDRIITISDEPETDSELVIDAIYMHKEKNFIFLRERFDRMNWDDDEIRYIADCADKKVIEFIKDHPETYDKTLPKLETQNQLNEHYERVIRRKVPELNFGISRWMDIATTSCMEDIKLGPIE